MDDASECSSPRDGGSDSDVELLRGRPHRKEGAQDDEGEANTSPRRGISFVASGGDSAASKNAAAVGRQNALGGNARHQYRDEDDTASQTSSSSLASVPKRQGRTRTRALSSDSDGASDGDYRPSLGAGSDTQSWMQPDGRVAATPHAEGRAASSAQRSAAARAAAHAGFSSVLSTLYLKQERQPGVVSSPLPTAAMHAAEDHPAVAPRPQPMRAADAMPRRFAAFEAHSRSFASKYMAKLGFEPGKGLGRDGTGRIAPVSDTVSVRPERRGLAFGGRERAVVAERDSDAESAQLHDVISLDSAGEQTGSVPQPRVREPARVRVKRVYRTATEVLAAAANDAPVTILDMRGPSSRVVRPGEGVAAAEHEDGRFQHGRELVHNAGLLADLAEARLRTMQRKVRELERKVQDCQQERERSRARAQHHNEARNVLEAWRAQWEQTRTDASTAEAAARAGDVQVWGRWCATYGEIMNQLLAAPDVARVRGNSAQIAVPDATTPVAAVVQKLVKAELDSMVLAKHRDEELEAEQMRERVRLLGQRMRTLSSGWERLLAGALDSHSRAQPMLRSVADSCIMHWLRRCLTACSLASGTGLLLANVVLRLRREATAAIPFFSTDVTTAFLQQHVCPAVFSLVHSWNPAVDAAPVHEWLFPWLHSQLLGGVSSAGDAPGVALTWDHIHTAAEAFRRIDSVSSIAGALQDAVISVTTRIAEVLRDWLPSDASALVVVAPWMPVLPTAEREAFLDAHIVSTKLAPLLRELHHGPFALPSPPVDWVLSWAPLLTPEQVSCLVSAELLGPLERACLSALVGGARENPVLLRALEAWYKAWKAALTPCGAAAAVVTRFLSRVMDQLHAWLCGHSLPPLPQGSARTYEQLRADRARLVAQQRMLGTARPHPSSRRDPAPQLSTREVLEATLRSAGVDASLVPHPRGLKVNSHAVYELGGLHVYIRDGVVYALSLAHGWEPVSMHDLARRLQQR